LRRNEIRKYSRERKQENEPNVSRKSKKNDKPNREGLPKILGRVGHLTKQLQKQTTIRKGVLLYY